MAWSCPYDFLSPKDNPNTPEPASAFFGKLLTSPVVHDSTSISTDETTEGSITCTKLPECSQFIRYKLLGIVGADSLDGTPVAAHLWNKFTGFRRNRTNA